ncbi:G/U mismatch-specific DNA glycosylase [Pontibacter akesuensis]|uniref:G/U mismatch-specific uracil-DNA glycosylase n=1 Tax=Pontibacter akesuensis TaxID=388950 RepID=A0A1I7K6N9_9BACT|nr:G/U mismatch-specific DNA glycosylase [Pontibacter akesuensis]GHA74694.1 mismatch-specific DNA-glycosylase [Pontibacter akesuensis]SFU93032.1 G/U mismatch-specific uracil-DNA glycosylase [Pontibacter akesuensis]
MVHKPTKVELAAAVGRTVPDVIAPNLKVLFCGINPSVYTAVVTYNFARPGNRFWPTLFAAGFTPRLFKPEEQQELLPLGFGITNVVDRATVAAADLSIAELRKGGKQLVEKVHKYNPQVLALLGISVYQAAFGQKGSGVGLQNLMIGNTQVWVLPNPSGLNAHFPPRRLAEVYRELQNYVG